FDAAAFTAEGSTVDAVAPQLLDFSTTQAHPGDTVTVSISASEHLNNVMLIYRSPLGDNRTPQGNIGAETSGCFTFEVNGYADREWPLESITVWDDASNTATYYADGRIIKNPSG